MAMVPGQFANDEIVLCGPDSTNLILDATKLSVEDAKRMWSEAHGAPPMYIQVLRSNTVLADDAG